MKQLILYVCKKSKRMSEHLRQLIEYATSQGYRSNTVKPLMGAMLICFIGSIAAYIYNASVIAYLFAGLGVVMTIAFLVAYFICLIKDPNLLRSERYNLEKTAIERTSVNDSMIGKRKIKAPSTEYVISESIKENEEVL